MDTCNKHDLDLPEATITITPDAKSPQGKIIDPLYTQEDADITGIYSDSTENYNYGENNTSSDTIVYTTDTEIYALKDYTTDALEKNNVNTKGIKGSKAKNKTKRKTKKLKPDYRRNSVQHGSSYPLFRCPMKTCGV